MSKGTACFFTACSLFFMLGGCGGGGGSMPSRDNPSPPPHNLEPSPSPDEPEPSPPDTDPGPLYSVLVGVADSGFRVTHESIEPKLVSTHNLADLDDPDVTTASWHGTAVASVISMEPNDAGLALAKVNRGEEQTSFSHVMDYSVGFLADEGARVINHSYSGRLEAPRDSASYLGENSLDSLHKIVSSNDGDGSVYVVAAANDGSEISADNPIYQYPKLFERMLIVGGSEGDELSENSNYPAEDETWQSRFLTAPWQTPVALSDADDSYGLGQGTSFAAPQVSAYAAAIIEMWPHLDARQVSRLLLDTASQESPLYDDDTCGADNNVNCGFFYLGQGEANLENALAPQGALTLPSGDTVQEGGYGIDESAAQVSNAYGNALASSDLLNEVAMFDDLGRDYSIDLSRHVARTSNRDQTMRRHMEQIATASNAHRSVSHSELGDFRFIARHNNYGEATVARLDGRLGRSAWSVFHFSGDEPNPMSPFVEADFMPMLSFQGGTDLTQQVDTVAGVSNRLALGDRITLVAEYWSGQADGKLDSLNDDYRANRSDIALAVDLTEHLTLTTGAGVVQEKQGLLGAQGTGALSFGEDNQLNMSRVQLDYRLAEMVSAFAVYEQGRGDMTGSGLIQDVKGIRTEETALGLQWSGKHQQTAIAFRQPMRIDDADATLSIPVGRTLDGDVLREDHNVSLAPSGQQQDIEFGYAVMPSERSRIQVNVLYSMEPGHDRHASDEISTLINYTLQF